MQDKMRGALVCGALGLIALGEHADAQTCAPSIVAVNPTSAYSVTAGVVVDGRSGLMWDQCAWGQSGLNCASGSGGLYSWNQALAIPATANLSVYKGYADWRLPNVKELLSLVEVCRINPSINDIVFPATPPSYFWSGSPIAGSSAWSVYFDIGFPYSSNRGYFLHVRLVRAGQ